MRFLLSTLSIFFVTKFVYAGVEKPHVVRCTPFHASESKFKVSFYYQDSQLKQKVCSVNTSDPNDQKNWIDTSCRYKEFEDRYQFELKGKDKNLTVKILKDHFNPDIFDGFIKGSWEKIAIDHALDCELTLED